MCPVVRALRGDEEVDLIFVHTAQHYDWNISERFLKELDLPSPHFFLNVRSGTHGHQTAKVIEQSESVLAKTRPSVVLVEGDTNSALGVSLASSKLNIPIGHVEAGCRSFDNAMPEETNRKMIADCSAFNFAPTRQCVKNLRREGVFPATIYFTGHPIVDLYLMMKPAIQKVDAPGKFGIKPENYALLTLHRQENTDDRQRLRSILRGVSSLPVPVIFPIHPRTRKRIAKYRLFGFLRNTIVTAPLGYLDTLSLIQKATVVLTDSGGVQQESYLLRTPCVTLRETTEWVETVHSRMNFLAGSTSSGITKTVKEVIKIRDTFHKRRITDCFGSGDAAHKILRIVKKFCWDAVESP